MNESTRSQGVRFCTSFDGVKLAYVVTGNGPALLEAAYTGNHLDYSRDNPVWRHWIRELSAGRTYVRYDARGCGLSDRDPAEISFEAAVKDVEAVANAACLENFALIGHTNAAAFAVAHAARHPQRVTHLVAFGGYARGRLKRGGGAKEIEEALLYYKLAEVGWDHPDSKFRRMFCSQWFPDAPPEFVEGAAELSRLAHSGRVTVQYLRLAHQIDLTDVAPHVACPALVVHSRDDANVDSEEGRRLAMLIPNSRFVALDSRNHHPIEDEPAWKQYVEELRAFLPSAAGQRAFGDLTRRERELLEFLARGLDNHQIAAHLALSEKTVRNMVSSILAKLEVESRSAAIVRAREVGFGVGSRA